MAGQIPLPRNLLATTVVCSSFVRCISGQNIHHVSDSVRNSGFYSQLARLTFAQKMAARLRSGGSQPVAGENVGGPPAEGESSSNVPAGLELGLVWV